jgi:hypothetical protein
VEAEATGDNVEGGVGEDAGRGDTEKDVAKEGLILPMELHLLDPVITYEICRYRM